MIKAVQGMKFQNQPILGVTNQGSQIINKQFSISTQHGLFPKISNYRADHQVVPGSVHSQAGLGAIKAIENNNVFKNNGGHISGMSNHQTQQTLNKQEVPNRNPQTGGANAITCQMSGDFSIGYKPLSSPRQHQKPEVDPSQVYNQQQWKTQVSMNYAEPNLKNNTHKLNDPSFSPLLGNNSTL
jgi:hypothetical protein